MKAVGGLFFITTLVGCSFSASLLGLTTSLEGAVPLYAETSLKANSQCADAQVGLYRLDGNGAVSNTPIATTSLDSSGRFVFRDVKPPKVTSSQF